MNNEANLLGKLGCPKCNLVLCPAHNSLVCPNCAFKVALSDGVAVVGEKPAPSYFDDKFEVMQKGHHSKVAQFLFCYEKQLQYIEPFLVPGPRSSLTSVAALVFPTTAAATASSLGWIPRSIRSASTSLWTFVRGNAVEIRSERIHRRHHLLLLRSPHGWLVCVPNPAPMFARHSRNLSGSQTVRRSVHCRDVSWPLLLAVKASWNLARKLARQAGPVLLGRT